MSKVDSKGYYNEHPHYFFNEDGRRMYHPGYTERRCQSCQRLFICSVDSIALLCGDPRYCKKEEEH